ncbi:prostaglandin E receptor 2b subtype EP2 [Pholidichthys leucotaenia]
MSMDTIGCQNRTEVESGNAGTSAAMFSAGVVGNIAALVLLELRRRKTGTSLYHVLVTALLTTDLVGTVSLTPVVLAAYARRRTVVGMSRAGGLCSFFGFSMTCLSLVTLALICAMALERALSIGQPYFYERRVGKRCGYVTVPLVYMSSVLFCLAPFAGFGEYVQYCPGTWCFLEMRRTDAKGDVCMALYASAILLLTCCTVACNIYVIVVLAKMHRRRKACRSGGSAHAGHGRCLCMSEEVEHLLPLAAITAAFICCTFPLVLRVYTNFTNRPPPSDERDLRALRLLSFHSIINPWVFIILRPSVLKLIWKKFCKPQKTTVLWGDHSDFSPTSLDNFRGRTKPVPAVNGFFTSQNLQTKKGESWLQRRAASGSRMKESINIGCLRLTAIMTPTRRPPTIKGGLAAGSPAVKGEWVADFIQDFVDEALAAQEPKKMWDCLYGAVGILEAHPSLWNYPQYAELLSTVISWFEDGSVSS